ncbi:hypothetical protein [Aliiglaciecola sp. LCG003]|uniref:hypothetical protein n=1 Tax=Aliiglaciecola sp. LCG003 TaxID=3053655 RepID=UPI002572ECA2|nr:hypothetical protein [Aliiglaciecola sp. LCG003]WJG08948.1 hypothetical protein QR722_16690 [Aliiglaciecola sp. LCG003]
MTTEITKTILLDHAVVNTHKGYITIKPLAQVLEDLKVNDPSAFINIPLWENTALNIAKHGTVHFGDNTWHSYEEAQRNLNFSGEDELTYQIRIYSLLKLTHGDVVGGKPLKISTLQNDATYLHILVIRISHSGFIGITNL